MPLASLNNSGSLDSKPALAKAASPTPACHAVNYPILQYARLSRIESAQRSLPRCYAESSPLRLAVRADCSCPGNLQQVPTMRPSSLQSLETTQTSSSLIALPKTLSTEDEAHSKRIRQLHPHMSAFLHSSLRTGAGITRHMTFSAVGQDPLDMPFWEDPLRHYVEWRFLRLP